jgi:hypothetical protein
MEKITVAKRKIHLIIISAILIAVCLPTLVYGIYIAWVSVEQLPDAGFLGIFLIFIFIGGIGLAGICALLSIFAILYLVQFRPYGDITADDTGFYIGKKFLAYPEVARMEIVGLRGQFYAKFGFVEPESSPLLRRRKSTVCFFLRSGTNFYVHFVQNPVEALQKLQSLHAAYFQKNAAGQVS